MAPSTLPLADDEPEAGPDDTSPPPVDLLRNAALFLDFDGTLVPIAERPDAIVVDDALDRLMDDLAAALDGRLAILSGRGLDEVDDLLVHGRFAVAGSHGLEIRFPDGRTTTPPPLPGKEDIIAQMQQLQAVYPGVIVEPKPFGAALHYRRRPEAEQACHALAIRLAAQDGLVLQSGKMVFEIRAAGRDKGAAMRTLLEHPALAGHAPIFIGDDRTDEAGFRAAQDAGGAGILVGPPRPTAANYRLPDVAAARAWLRSAAGGAE